MTITPDDIRIELADYLEEREERFAGYVNEAAYCAAPWAEIYRLREILLSLNGFNPSITAAKLRQKFEHRYMRMLDSLPECVERTVLLDEWRAHEMRMFEECMGEDL